MYAVGSMSHPNTLRATSARSDGGKTNINKAINLPSTVVRS